MRIFSYLLGVLFTVFALVQLNDPDPLIWVLVYMATAVIAFLFPHKKLNKWLLLAFAIAFLTGAILLFPPSMGAWLSAEEKSKSLGMTLPGIEEARESMGLILCFLTMIFYWTKAR
jgi:hypothetical protein